MENKNKTYNPTPIDVSSIVVPSDLNLLIEKLAKNVHDNWAANRLKDGWSYGPVHDDIKKQTPCLVEYEDLPESEKNYYRGKVLAFGAACAVGSVISSLFD